MDIRKVKKLIELLEESGIAELEIKEGENEHADGGVTTHIIACGSPKYMDATNEAFTRDNFWL